LNIALIFAGGTGQRMGSGETPKQFLKHRGKPILIYTLERFQNHSGIDSIVLVCLKDWMEYASDLIEQYNLTKVVKIVAGGKTGQESIFQGISLIAELYSENDIVLVHDGVRPFISSETIDLAIESVKKYGSGIAASPAIETIVVADGEEMIGRDSILNRSRCFYAKAPQCFFVKDLYRGHVMAKEEGISDFIDSASLMSNYGHQLHLVPTEANNIKITTPTDYVLFCALVDGK